MSSPSTSTDTLPPFQAPLSVDAAASRATTGALAISKAFLVSCSHWVPAANARRWCWCGHNWNVVTHLAGGLDAVGMVHDFGELRPVQDVLKSTVDHRHLDDVVPGPPASCARAAMRLGGFVYEQLTTHCGLPFSSLIREVQVVDTWPDRSWPAWRQVVRPWRFHAAHRLDGLPDGHKCGRQHGHGYMAGAVMDQGHFEGAIDIVRMLQPAGWFVRDQLHRQALNDALNGLNPTAEHLAQFLFAHFTEQLRINGIARILVAETPGTLAEYRP